MSVKTLESYQEFTADGSTTYFTFNFNYVDSSEIVVGMRTGDNQYTVVDPVSYVLTKNASTDGGKIRFVTTKPCENPDDPTCGDYIDNPPPAGTIVRIERKTVQSSTADWYVGLDMNALVSLFDKLFRISQENSDKFKNTIQTFPTQQGITVRELLSEHDKKIFYWNNEKQWLDITDFTIDDIVRQTDVGDILEQANAYSDEQNALLENRINGKLTAVNAQIDANADAIQKTREDYIQADSEIHQILNNHAENLTTLHNDVDDLGDQVAEIESKIPESASSTNPLVTKGDLADIDLDGYVKKSGDTMTGDLVFDVVESADIIFQDSTVDTAGNTNSVRKIISASHQTQGFVFSEIKNGVNEMQFSMVIDGLFMPFGNRLLGNADYPWENIYAKKLNNGADVAIPTEGGTLARIEDLIDLRADINEADSELQTQITAQATAIAGKVDVAGDTMTGTLNVPELNVATDEGTFNVGIVAGVATIATNNGLDIVAKTKFDTAPTTDDSTTWADALDTSLVRKAQVAAAIAASGGGSGGGASLPDQTGNAGKFLTTDGAEASWGDALPLSGGTLTGALSFGSQNYSIRYTTFGLTMKLASGGDAFSFRSQGSNVYFIPVINLGATLGKDGNFWSNVYTAKLNNGADLIVPTEGGTLARLEDLEGIGGSNLPDQAGNEGKVLTTDGTDAEWADMPGLIIRSL